MNSKVVLSAGRGEDEVQNQSNEQAKAYHDGRP
jgi:hypothetical protein